MLNRRHFVASSAAVCCTAQAQQASVPNATPITPAIPVEFGKDKTAEIRQFFGYWCPHCANLEPSLEAWLKTLPATVQFKRTPVVYNFAQKAWSRLFFTLDSMPNSEALHAAIFKALHETKDLDIASSVLDIQAFCSSKLGIPKQTFDNAWNSFSISGFMAKAEKLSNDAKVRAIPSFMINGRQMVISGAVISKHPSYAQGVSALYKELEAQLKLA